MKTAAAPRAKRSSYGMEASAPRQKTSPTPTRRVLWCDGDTAFSVLSSGDDEAIIAAMTEKKLQSEGNYREFIWFLTALGKLSA